MVLLLVKKSFEIGFGGKGKQAFPGSQGKERETGSYQFHVESYCGRVMVMPESLVPCEGTLSFTIYPLMVPV